MVAAIMERERIQSRSSVSKIKGSRQKNISRNELIRFYRYKGQKHLEKKAANMIMQSLWKANVQTKETTTDNAWLMFDWIALKQTFRYTSASTFKSVTVNIEHNESWIQQHVKCSPLHTKHSPLHCFQLVVVAVGATENVSFFHSNDIQHP